MLDLLQARPLVTGREIADRLDVDGRTVRRDVAALQRLGIPVEGERGVGGGYRLRPGFRLPPLMLSEDEATAVVLGLTAARRLGLGEASGADGALSKIHRVLPDALRRRVEALEAALVFTARAPRAAPPAGETTLLLADAIRRRRRVRVEYRSFAGEETERDLSAYGLVVHAGRWYLAAYDHVREALRTFRVDRMRNARIGVDAAIPPPDGFDALAHVSRSLARVPWPLGDRGSARVADRRRAAPCSRDARRARRGGRRDTAADARELARLGRDVPRRARLPVPRSQARRAAGEHARARAEPRELVASGSRLGGGPAITPSGVATGTGEAP
jgi:predicted DNA-binding transcriptional regulator YafY